VQAAPLAASLLVIGDEILGGFVTDTNSPWFADRMRLHGVSLERIHVIPDDAEAIATALHAELGRARPRLVVTSGGIGSTPDDITFEAIAAALGRPLVADPVLTVAMDGLIARTAEAGFPTDGGFADHVMRMARIPAGSRLMAREGGWTPAVCVDVEGGADAVDGLGASIVILPGVPSEFRALLEHAIEPRLVVGRNIAPHIVELTHGLPESLLNLTFVAMSERFPAVKLGSYPGRPMIIRLTGPHQDVEGAAAFVQAGLDRLESDPAAARLPSRRSAT
jgi:molybdenum cofactor synthesis domain-containing protein